MATTELLKRSPISPESITTINDLPSTPVATTVASPLSIILYELLENCIQHAFDNDGVANFIALGLEFPTPDAKEQKYKLRVKDNGTGMPAGMEDDAIESSGLAVVRALARRLSGRVNIEVDNGTSVCIDISVPVADQEFDWQSTSDSQDIPALPEAAACD